MDSSSGSSGSDSGGGGGGGGGSPEVRPSRTASNTKERSLEGLPGSAWERVLQYLPGGYWDAVARSCRAGRVAVTGVDYKAAALRLLTRRDGCTSAAAADKWATLEQVTQPAGINARGLCRLVAQYGGLLGDYRVVMSGCPTGAFARISARGTPPVLHLDLAAAPGSDGLLSVPPRFTISLATVGTGGALTIVTPPPASPAPDASSAAASADAGTPPSTTATPPSAFTLVVVPVTPATPRCDSPAFGAPPVMRPGALYALSAHRREVSVTDPPVLSPPVALDDAAPLPPTLLPAATAAAAAAAAGCCTGTCCDAPLARYRSARPPARRHRRYWRPSP